MSTESFRAPVVEWRVLESSGCDIKDTLLAVRDKYGGDFFVTEQMSKDRFKENKYKTLSTLFGEPVFHKEEKVEDAGRRDQEFFVEFGDDPQKGFDRELEKPVIEAAKNELLGTGEK